MGNTNSINASTTAVTPQVFQFAPSDGFFAQDAAARGDIGVLALFLQKNPALVWATSVQDKSTAWHYAAQEGHVEVLRLLLSASKEGAASNTFDPTCKIMNQANSKGLTALMLACNAGHFTCAQLLLEGGADVFAVDGRGLNALHHAALAPQGGCMQLVLSKAGLWGPRGPRPARPDEAHLSKFVNAGDAVYGRTPLHYASWSGQMDGAVALLAAGASILARSAADCYDSDLPCNSGTTPLHLAAMRGHQSVVVVIMAAYVKAVQRHRPHPDPRTVTDAYNNTPHSIALSRNHDAPLLLRLLDPATSIKELAKISRSAIRGAADGSAVGEGRFGDGSDADEECSSSGGGSGSEGGDGDASSGGSSSDASSGGRAQEPDTRRKGRRRARARSLAKLYDKARKALAAGSPLAPGQPVPPTQMHAFSRGGMPTASGRAAGGTADKRSETITPRPSQPQPAAGAAGSDAGATAADGAAGAAAKPGPTHSAQEQQEQQQQQQQQSEVGPQVAAAAAQASNQPASPAGAAPGGSPPYTPPLPAQQQQQPEDTPDARLSRHPVPDCFLCPLTCKIMQDPVVAADGVTYERSAIEKYFATGNLRSPSTKQKLHSQLLFPNKNLLEAMEYLAAVRPFVGQDLQ